MRVLRLRSVIAVMVVAAAAACSRTTSVPPTEAVTLTPLSTVTATLEPTLIPTAMPTATPEPLAATVNGEPITIAAYEAEVQRCAAGRTDAGYDLATCGPAALDFLTEQTIVEAAARSAQLEISEAEVDAAWARILSEQGSEAAFEDWLLANLYTPAEFRAALGRELLRAKMAEQIAAAVGPAAEQVHARQILVTDDGAAQEALAQIQSGADFATVALIYSRDLSSRAAGGDLGWFPRGVLTVPEVEAAAFSLQPGETSALIHSELGLHIVQTLEREPARTLSPAAAQTLRAAAFAAWLDGLVAGADIIRYVNP